MNLNNRSRKLYSVILYIPQVKLRITTGCCFLYGWLLQQPTPFSKHSGCCSHQGAPIWALFMKISFITSYINYNQIPN